MSRRRQQRRTEKARRHPQPPRPAEWPSSRAEPRWPIEPPVATGQPRVVVREASYVERLAYTRSQAAAALGFSRSTLSRLLPYVDTIEMPWGGTLIPVEELERLVAERRQAARARRSTVKPGRKPSVPTCVVERVRAARAAGLSLRQIAADLNADGTPTAHGGRQWWPSTVRAILVRSSPVVSTQKNSSTNGGARPS